MSFDYLEDEVIEAALVEAGLPVRFCGLNADWNVRAWHLGPSDKPNQVDGDFYILDYEDGTFCLTSTVHVPNGYKDAPHEYTFFMHDPQPSTIANAIAKAKAFLKK